MYILFAIVCFTMLVLLTCLLALYNYRPVEEFFDFEYQIINMFKSDCHNKNDGIQPTSSANLGQLQGVINYEDYIYVVSTKSICQHDKKSGKLIKKVKTNLEHLNGGIVKDNKLYLAHNTKKLNSIEIFDLDLKHLDSIKLDHLKGKGSLTWIDYYDNSWWGALAHYGKQVEKTRLVKFKDDWQIGASWYYPKNILDRLKPYSNSGGQFDKESGLLFLTGHDKEEVYIMKVNPKSLNLINIEIMQVPIGGQGILLENKEGNLHMFGLNRQDENIYEILIK